MSRREKAVAAVALTEGGERHIHVVGQSARTLRALIEYGPFGLTALEMSSWALRLSQYIFTLRRDHGLDIEMVREQHVGGWHGRYVLHSQVRIVSDGGAEVAA